MLPRIALTPGEPAGLGPDVVIAAAQKSYAAEIIAICDPKLIAQRAQQLNVPLSILAFEDSKPSQSHQAGTLKVLPVSLNVAAKQANSIEKTHPMY